MVLQTQESLTWPSLARGSDVSFFEVEYATFNVTIGPRNSSTAFCGTSFCSYVRTRALFLQPQSLNRQRQIPKPNTRNETFELSGLSAWDFGFGI